MINDIITDITKPMVKPIVGGAAAAETPSQFITKGMHVTAKQITRGFMDYLVNTGQPIPVGAINDNNAPLSYGDTRIYGLFHTVSTSGSGSEYTNLVINADGIHGNEGWTSVTINGVTYQRGVASTQFTGNSSVFVTGGTASVHIFTFTNTSLAVSGFDEPDNTELQITWSI